MEKLTFPSLGKFAFRLIAAVFVIVVIAVAVVGLESYSSATQAEVTASEDVSPAMEPLGPGQNDRFYYVDRKTDYVYETYYEGDIINLQIAYSDNGEIMKSTDYYAVIK